MQILRALQNLITMLDLRFWGIKKDQRPPDVPWYEYARAKNEWLIEHTDDLFGRPVDFDGALYFENARRNWDSRVISNEYMPPFSYSPFGKVRVLTDEFPLVDQKLIFEWMSEKMNEVSLAVTQCLLRSARSWGLEDEEAAGAFRPDRIRRIEFKGSCPVSWVIIFDTDIGEGEALVGNARGKDQYIESVELDYG